ncbi:MAG: 6-bladed beta-propeller [Flavobacteriaceae bacterium]|nr:6-bladed beta-propeller [Flavobacteriaceae bacterium]MDG2235176.1 6-bladed beta-propeller [Flavobacteriaceae bacterium]
MIKNNRRQFIKKTCLAAGIAISPFENIYPITNKAIEENSIIGHGDFRYRVDKKWGIQDPAQFPVNDCHEMILDKKNRIFMTTTHPKNNILIYDRGGKILGSWGTDYPGAHGLTISEEGEEEFLFITDPETHKVCKTTLKGRKLFEINTPREISDYKSEDQFKPTETAIAPNGDIYVADGYGLDFIIQYDKSGNYIRHFGGKGNKDDNFDCCHGIVFDSRDKNNSLLITSRSENVFKRFTPDGKHIQTINLPSCYICRPVLKNGMLYFAVIVTKDWGTYDGMLAVLDENNSVVSFPGGSKPVYNNSQLIASVYDQSTFFNPHDICVDNDEDIYVPQWNSGKTYPLKLTRV